MFQTPKVINARNSAADAVRSLHGVEQDALTVDEWDLWDEACGNLEYCIRRLMLLESKMEETHAPEA